MAQRLKPTPELTQAVCSLIRHGVYPHTAAAAHGISPTTLAEWLERGERRGAAKGYREFAAEVAQAEAHARTLAESAVFKDDKKCWLRSGPGRERPDSPGWTTSAKPFPPQPRQTNLLQDPEWNRGIGEMLAALDDYPEARAVLAERFGGSNTD